jgi:hypothetical protein
MPATQSFPAFSSGNVSDLVHRASPSAIFISGNRENERAGRCRASAMMKTVALK